MDDAQRWLIEIQRKFGGNKEVNDWIEKERENILASSGIGFSFSPDQLSYNDELWYNQAERGPHG